jgi:hypothetical protein
VVVADEDPQVRLTSDPSLDPTVVLTADLALIEIRLLRIDPDQRQRHLRAAAATAVDGAVDVPGRQTRGGRWAAEPT